MGSPTVASNRNNPVNRHSLSVLATKRIAPYVFSAPFILVYFTFLAFPILYTFYMSLTDWTPFSAPFWVGFENYLELFSDPLFFKALGNTFVLMGMIIPIQLCLGMLIAVLLTSKFMRFKDGFRLLNFLPYLTTPVALGLFFAILFDPNFGYINMAMRIIGLPAPDWTGAIWPARSMVALVTVWRWSGYTAVMLMAGITNISEEIFEACDIDGANGWQRFAHITLPLLKPIVIFVTLTTLIGCFQIFEEPLLLFSGGGSGVGAVGGPRGSVLTGVWMMYDTGFGTVMRYGYGATVSYGLFIAIGLVTLIYNKLVGIRRD